MFDIKAFFFELISIWIDRDSNKHSWKIEKSLTKVPLRALLQYIAIPPLLELDLS